MDVVDGDAIRLSLLNQLKAKRVVALDVEHVVDHGVDQCCFAGSGDAHQQNRFMLTMAGTKSVAESETIDFGPRFAGFNERHCVKVQLVMITDLFASILNGFDGPNILVQRGKFSRDATRILVFVIGNYEDVN